MISKRNIRTFGKTFAYLKDPALRSKETGNGMLVVDGAVFSGERFDGVDWLNIVFKHCDFVGAYEIKPKTTRNVRYEDCRFAGILSYGVASNVHFLRCGWAADSVMFSEKGSKATVFEECNFVGTSADPNHQGGVGSDGEAQFLRCTSKWFAWTGDESLSIVDCTCEDTTIHTDSIGNSGEGFLYASVHIEGSKLRGNFRMVATNLKSISIRDTTIETLDLTNATVQGDVVMERVKGGALQLGIQEGARNFVLRDSQIYGDGDTLCTVYAGAFQSVLVENTAFGGGPGKRVVIGGGFEPDEKNPQPVMTQSIVFRGVQVPSLRTGRVNAAHVLFEGNTIDSLELMQSRIGKLELKGNSLARSVDFTDTQVGESNVQPLADGQAKLEGSNIRLVR